MTEPFKISECERELKSMYEKTRSLSSRYGLQKQFAEFDLDYQRDKKSQRIIIVFAGAYSVGKSTIIHALTGDDTIKIDSDETTSESTEYLWGDNLILVDTPGLYTETQSNAEKAEKSLRDADIIAYCITPRLFTPDTKGEFLKLLSEHRKKVFLCVNKCEDQSNACEREDAIIEAIGEDNYEAGGSILPIIQFSVQDYERALKTDDRDLADYSNFGQFIVQMENFAKENGTYGKIEKRLKRFRAFYDSLINELSSKYNVAQNEKAKSDFERDLRKKKRAAERELENIDAAYNDIAKYIRDSLNNISDYSELAEIEDKVSRRVQDVENESLSKIKEMLSQIGNEAVTICSNSIKWRNPDVDANAFESRPSQGGSLRNGASAAGKFANSIFGTINSTVNKKTLLGTIGTKLGFIKPTAFQKGVGFLATHGALVTNAFNVVGWGLTVWSAYRAEENAKERLKNIDTYVSKFREQTNKRLANIKTEVNERFNEIQDNVNNYIPDDQSTREGRLKTEITALNKQVDKILASI